MRRGTVALLVAASMAIAVAVLLVVGRERPIFVFEGVRGPVGRAMVAAPRPAAWAAYRGGSGSRLAILLTDTNSAWLGLAHGLKSAGIPFSITTDYREALGHKVILAYPTISGAVLKPAALQALAAVPRKGGTLIGVNVLGGGLQTVFGFREAVPSRARYRLTMQGAIAGAADDKETTLPLGRADKRTAAFGSHAYTEPREAPVATYDDGSAAIVGRRIGAGWAYAVGIDLGALLLKGYNNREEGFARSYVNGFEPMLDVLLRFIAGVYRQGDDRAVILRPVPEGKDLAVVISHDIDYTRSLVNAIDYARFERQAGIRATYFIQTKYLKDWNDDIILGDLARGLLRQLDEMGMELASHGVSHSLLFRDFPLGDGSEAYPDYRPFVKDAATTYDGSILGELRVSRFLIETLSGSGPVVSFRPGHLSNPYALPQALAATGYRYSSSVTANNSLTHLPFQLNHDRAATGKVPIFEFPVTIEDEAPPRLGDRLPEAIALASKIARHGGLCMVLIHPDILGHKLDFERGFVQAVAGFSWFGALGDYGAWWAARNDVQVDVEAENDRLVLHFRAPKPVHGLTLELPPDVRLVPSRTEPAVGARMVGDRLVIDKLEGAAEIELVRK